MSNIVLFIKKHYVVVLSALLPVLLLIIAFTVNKLYPFGKYFLGAYDASVQYPGFTNYFMEVLKGNESILFSFKGLLGYNFYATAVYYLFNPTNLLSIFFDSKNIIDYYTIIVFLRIALCGFTMAKLLLYKEKKGVFTVLVSTAYALMAYNILYFFNFMYFDSIVLFPLVILGIEKLIYERKKALYLVTLTLSIISNFYIGYMICIFSLIYFIYKYILLDKKNMNKKIIKDFIILSILSACISAFTLLPVIYEILSGKIEVFGNNEFTKYWVFGRDAIDVIYRFTIGTFAKGDISYGPPNVYVSLFVVSLTVLYFFNKKITKKEKIVTLSVILFFILCFSFNLFDYAWHMFQRPIWYPNRYSFIFSFFLCITGYKCLCNLDGLKLKNLKSLFIIVAMILLVLVSAFINNAFTEKINLLFLFLSFLCIIQYILGINHKYAYIFCTVLFILEVSSNTVMSIKNLAFSTTKDFYYIEENSYDKAVTSTEKNETENSFYRMEFSNRLNYNNGASFMYNGINYFSSLRNGRIMNLFENFNYRVGDKASMVYNFYNPYMNAFLGIKYLSGTDTEFYYEFLHNDGYFVYKNNDAFPLGILTNGNLQNSFDGELWQNTKILVNTLLNKDLKIYEAIDKYTITGAQQAIRGNEQYIVESNKDNAKVTLEYNTNDNGFIVFDNNLKTYLNPKVYINNTEVINYNSSYTTPIFVKKGDNIKIDAYYGGYEYPVRYLKAYFINYSDYKEFISLKENGIKIINYEKDNYVKGEINIKEKSQLITTIPYDKGWTILVNGKQIEYFEALNSFIAINLDEGMHTIEFKFFPRGLKSGIILTLISIIGSIIYIKKKEA